MRAPELVEFAALVSAHAAVLIEGTFELSVDGLAQYWAASRCRLDRWASAFKFSSLTQATSTPQGMLDQPPPATERSSLPASRGYLKGVLAEILASEVLTRVWSGVLVGCDRKRGDGDAAPIAQSVLAGHVEARNRALKLLAHGPGVTSHDAVQLNRIRRQSERWTDLLLGHLTTIVDVSELAFHPSVACEFAEELRGKPGWSAGGQAWLLWLASLRAGFRRDFGLMSPNADLNAQIASAILGCFPPELFDSTGLVQSLWLTRLSRATDDMQGLISQLFQAESGRSPVAPDFVIRKRPPSRGGERGVR